MLPMMDNTILTIDSIALKSIVYHSYKYSTGNDLIVFESKNNIKFILSIELKDTKEDLYRIKNYLKFLEVIMVFFTKDNITQHNIDEKDINTHPLIKLEKIDITLLPEIVDPNLRLIVKVKAGEKGGKILFNPWGFALNSINYHDFLISFENNFEIQWKDSTGKDNGADYQYLKDISREDFLIAELKELEQKHGCFALPIYDFDLMYNLMKRLAHNRNVINENEVIESQDALYEIDQFFSRCWRN